MNDLFRSGSAISTLQVSVRRLRVRQYEAWAALQGHEGKIYPHAPEAPQINK